MQNLVPCPCDNCSFGNEDCTRYHRCRDYKKWFALEWNKSTKNIYTGIIKGKDVIKIKLVRADY